MYTQITESANCSLTERFNDNHRCPCAHVVRYGIACERHLHCRECACQCPAHRAERDRPSGHAIAVVVGGERRRDRRPTLMCDRDQRRRLRRDAQRVKEYLYVACYVVVCG